MRVCFPLSLMIDCALLASSGRTKFEDSVLLTTFSPASMATGSSVAQYFPSRYSRTKTGTLAPTFTLRTKSLRTPHQPKKIKPTVRNRGLDCYQRDHRQELLVR